MAYVKLHYSIADITVCSVTHDQDANTQGALDYLPKPFEREQILGAVQGVLARRSGSAGEAMRERGLTAGETCGILLSKTKY